MRTISVAMVAALASLALAPAGRAVAGCGKIAISIDSIERTGPHTGRATLNITSFHTDFPVSIYHPPNANDPSYNKLRLGNNTKCMDITERISNNNFDFQQKKMLGEDADYGPPNPNPDIEVRFNYQNTALPAIMGPGRETHYYLYLTDAVGNFTIDPKIQNQPPMRMFLYALEAALGVVLTGIVATLALNPHALTRRPRLFGALIAIAVLIAGLIALSLGWI